MKVIVPHFTAFFDFCSAKYSSANYIFDVILMRILQFSQNTENNDLCYAKYRMKCYAKYNFFKRMLRKIQDIMLRKIQIYVKIVPQNTGKNCCV